MNSAFSDGIAIISWPDAQSGFISPKLFGVIMNGSVIRTAMALAFAASAVTAQAATYSNQYVTITTDSSVWSGVDIAWDASTSTLTFDKLFKSLGLSASTTNKISTSSVTKDATNIFSVVANTGYVLGSVTTTLDAVINANANKDQVAWAQTTANWGVGASDSTPSHVFLNTNGNHSASAVVDLAGAKSASLDLANLSVYAKAPSGGVASSKIQDLSFSFAVTPVPEPDTYAIFLAGLGIIGGIATRRNRTA